jgi:hypothetical protein
LYFSNVYAKISLFMSRLWRNDNFQAKALFATSPPLLEYPFKGFLGWHLLKLLDGYMNELLLCVWRANRLKVKKVENNEEKNNNLFKMYVNSKNSRLRCSHNFLDIFNALTFYDQVTNRFHDNMLSHILDVGTTLLINYTNIQHSHWMLLSRLLSITLMLCKLEHVA